MAICSGTKHISAVAARHLLYLLSASLLGIDDGLSIRLTAMHPILKLDPAADQRGCKDSICTYI